MKYKFIFSLFALIILAVFTVTLSPLDNSFAAEIKAEPLPTPRVKVVKNKTIREHILFDREFDGKEIVKTEDQWKKLLTATEFYIMRQEGTEQPYTGDLLKNKKQGIYHCAACGLALFTSEAKYESDTGWPSFYKPIFAANVVEVTDTSLAETRTEIECARCHSHIGHVFNDGPKPTGLRYCMNGLAMRFQRTGELGHERSTRRLQRLRRRV